jgi:DNA repair exonuclease SbcCD ATPase subunit
MKLLSLELHGYRQFASPLRIDLPGGLVGVCGPNGVGKSKLVESIGFALYGSNRRVLPAGDRARDLPSRGVESAKPSVTLRLELRGQVLRVSRTVKTATLEIEGGGTLADSPSGVTKRITQLLRLSPDAYLGTFVARQREVSRLLTMRPMDRQRLVNRLIGVSQVETAIELAKEEKARRSQSVALAEAALTRSPDLAERVLTEQLEALALAESQLHETQDARDVLAERVRSAREAFNQARSARERVQDLENQMKELAKHKSSLDREASGVRERLQEVMDAEAALSESLSILEATDSADEYLETFELLKQKQELNDRLVLLEADSKERKKRLEVLTVVTEKRAALHKAFAETVQAVKSAELLSDDARHRASAIAQQRANALNLGSDGICDVCGQRYGDSFATALAHFDQERGELLASADLSDRAVGDAKRQHADLLRQAQELDLEVKTLSAAIEKLADVPGRLTICRDELGQIEDRLSSGTEITTAYDEVSHLHARQQALRRARAASEVERLRMIANGRSMAEESLKIATASLQDLEKRRATLDSAISKANHETAGLEAAQTELEALEVMERDAIDAVTVASGAVSAKTMLRDQAKRELELSIERAAVLHTARRNSLVAERTVDVLVRLLTEITNEARPRLAELMDTWGRSLMGSRFKSIDLSEDYGIIADNGSGRHELSHFSGGEQTVLSVMLRLAISLFCRERAGFDTGFLVLDEIFGDQDSEHRVLLVEFLSEIQQHYHQVLVVNHVDDVTAMLDSIIDVIPTGANTSTAILRST